MWTKLQIKCFAKEIRTSEVGKAWAFLVPDIRHAIVEAKVLTIVCGLDRKSIDVETIQNLRTDLHNEMCTEDSFGM